jgi:acetyl-CoA synthetase
MIDATPPPGLGRSPAWAAFTVPSPDAHAAFREARDLLLGLREDYPEAQRCRETTFCAMPTVWRMQVETPLEPWRDRLALRELVGAGERLERR